MSSSAPSEVIAREDTHDRLGVVDAKRLGALDRNLA